MKKNVYSLVLSEGVIEAVDRMAYVRGLSRSALINQILAEAVGYVTPEQRMDEILQTLTQQVTGLFQLQTQASKGSVVIRSPIHCRYKPTIRYRVELQRQAEQTGAGQQSLACGILRASFRTQSRPLIADAESFFRYWSACEIAAGFCTPENCTVSEGCFSRRFCIRNVRTTEEIGDAIGQYIRRLDAALKAYFAALPDKSAAEHAAGRFFRQEET